MQKPPGCPITTHQSLNSHNSTAALPQIEELGCIPIQAYQIRARRQTSQRRQTPQRDQVKSAISRGAFYDTKGQAKGQASGQAKGQAKGQARSKVRARLRAIRGISTEASVVQEPSEAKEKTIAWVG
ncbi:hypothetical protein B0T26DRAFT_385283 [Lasiosphaeria miniovina]|uniref:Uncharacterized protein n=1 Tax=Lasiosphaeria miniovina TaxID=1954250 RepID=A0AA40AE11_9PEZI|nr:uncharacterized protein B0T26DRAFT_385283 [Lasiosphaeria miniovina]KAK0714121.1 hypothetical protein B0T26DRAFT_385283 [Lasiosphaeria miniovina]